jgi:tRNA (guanine37-N1)-methyltransferase
MAKRFDVLTIFPEVIAPYAAASILGKAQKKDLLKIEGHDLRKYSTDAHKKVDDTPYGGGAGMVMTVQPFDAAVSDIKLKKKLLRTAPKTRVIMTAASGKRFTQSDAKRLAEYDQVIFLCGRYEGIDYRVEEAIADEALSIGDYVLTGGELPALVMIDAIARNIPGVLGNDETILDESHGEDGMLEYPQYTKPAEYKIGKKTYSVPEILLSGDHKKIKTWREGGKKKAGV